ncbi:MAG: transposase [Candidatus Aureabacteria bacterium]|nr:transposase [Candidatus Auribacterota bacterium]
MKTATTMSIGEFTAHETLRQCADCENHAVYASNELARLAPERCRFGYDVIVFVGLALFRSHRTVGEIVEALRERNVSISPSEVEYLGKKFIVYLALSHRQCTPKIREAMHEKGGSIFHLDGNCEGGAPVLMSGLDSLSEIVLGNVKLPSEKAEQIIPFIKEMKSRFGSPLALIHDMGGGILRAIKIVFPNTPDFVCHYHFLRDIGQDLFGQEYDLIRNRLRRHGITGKLRYHARRLKMVMDQNPPLLDAFIQRITNQAPAGSCIEEVPILSAYSLIQWALAGKHQGRGYGFPFDRPHVVFANRLRTIYTQIEQIKDIHLRGEWQDNKPLFKLACELKPVFFDTSLQRTLDQIDAKIKVFDQLRKAMRIAPPHGSEGLNSGDLNADMGGIEKAVRKFRARVVSAPQYATNPAYQKMIAQIDHYWQKLFADPIIVETPQGRIIIQPQRTNNIMERFFRDLRRGNRRKSGNTSMGKTLHAMLADTPLVRNLENPHYTQILLNGYSTLEERFADLDVALAREELRNVQITPERVPTKIRKLIDDPIFPDSVVNIFRKCA